MAETNSIGRPGVLFISALTLCVAIIIGLQAVILQRLFTQCNDNDVIKPAIQSSGQSCLQNIGGVLYTDDEILELARAWRRNSSLFVGDPDDVSKNCSGDYCFIELYAYETPCCQVTPGIASVQDIETDTSHVKRNIAKFAGKSQFFYTEHCKPSGSSDNCRCTTTNDLIVSAVYTDPGNRYGISSFKLGTLCKSLNT